MLGRQTGQDFGEQLDALFGRNIRSFDFSEKVFDELEERFRREIVQLKREKSYQISGRPGCQKTCEVRRGDVEITTSLSQLDTAQ